MGNPDWVPWFIGFDDRGIVISNSSMFVLSLRLPKEADRLCFLLLTEMKTLLPPVVPEIGELIEVMCTTSWDVVGAR